MEIELINEENNHVKYGIIYARTDVEDCLEQEIEAIQPEVKVNGFRPGKVPTDYILRMYGEKLRIQAMNKKVTSDILSIIKENKYDLAAQPVYNFRPRQEIDDNNFYVELDLFLTPSLPEMVFDKVEMTTYKPNEEAFQQILDKNLLMFQIMTADFEEITDKPSEENDKVIFNVEVIVDGELASGLSGQVQAILGQEQAPAEIEAQLKGRKANEEIVYTHHYPADAIDLFSPSLAGTETVYKIKIEKIERPIIRELDEDRIKKIGFRDYEHLFEVLETNTHNTLNGISLNKLKHDFLAYLHDFYNNVLVPDFIINQEAHHIAMAELSAITDSDIMEKITAGMIDLNVTEQHCETAKKRVRVSLFIKELSKNHNITVSDRELKQELEKHLQELQRLNSIKPEQKEQNYREISSKARAIVLEAKVFQSVFKLITLKEVHLSKDAYFDTVKIA